MRLKENKKKFKKIAAFIGRFQPVHYGHTSIIKELAKKNDLLYIVVASFSKTSKTNPLTFREAKKSLVKSLIESRINVSKIKISTIRRPKRYKGDPLFYIHAELQRRLKQPFTFYTGNKTVYSILCSKKTSIKFLKEIAPRNNGKIIKPPKGKQLTSELVRDLIVNGKEWEHLIPKAAAKMLKEQKIIERIKMLADKKYDIHPHCK